MISNLLFSTVHLIVVLLLMAVGALCVALPLSEAFRFNVTMALLHKPELFTKIGYGLLGSGLVIGFGFFALNRRRYLQLAMGGISVDPALVEEYVRDYWRTLFPGKEVAVTVAGKRLEVISSLGFVEEEVLEKIERELTTLFAQKLGYGEPFLLTIS